MKKTFFRFAASLSLITAGFLGVAADAKAQAYDMIYQDTVIAMSPGLMSHTFSFHLYQNCNPAPVNFSNLPVVYNPGNGMVATEFLAGLLPVVATGNPFCGSQAPGCSVSGLLNYQKFGTTYTFATKANFAAAGYYTTGTEFTAYGVGFGSFQAANISGNFSIDPRVLHSVTASNTVTTPVTNRPPEFINPAVIFANAYHPVSYSCAARDADGDSLVYRLRPVSPNATYATGFTYLNPITANPALTLNARTGIITFTPTAYDMAAGPGATANKYVIGIDVDEYRKGSTGVFKIGTIQRNVLVNVISTGNNSPVLTANYNGAAVAPNTIIDVNAGTTVEMNFGASDADTWDVVSPGTNAMAVLPRSTFFVTLGSNPNGGRITWTPLATEVRSEPYFFNVTATDNFCPYPASITHTYGIRVRNVTGISPEAKDQVHFRAFPNPATREVNFNFSGAAGEIVISNALGQEIDRISLPAGTENSQTIRWDRSGKFGAGLYVAKLISADKTVQTLKFTKLQ